MSELDLEAGARWNERIQRELSETRFGILCVTSQNVAAPWLLFEAGALAKTLQDIYVCPYLINLEPFALPRGPLAQFQAKRANKAETKALVMTINQALGENALEPARVERSFERWWPDLESVLASLPQENSLEAPVPQRTPEDMLEEILLLVREIGRQERSTVNIKFDENVPDILEIIAASGKEGLNPVCLNLGEGARSQRRDYWWLRPSRVVREQVGLFNESPIEKRPDEGTETES